MTKPVLLETPKVEADKKLVKELRALLADAESGELESVCFVAWMRNGIMKDYQFAGDITRKIGALTRMIHDLLR